MNAIKAILNTRGRKPESMEIGEKVSVGLDSPVMMPLIIEKTDEDEVSVGHYYSENGDRMRDPEVVFDLDGQEWVPIRFQQDPHINRSNSTGLDLDGFLDLWDRNLRRQGYVTAEHDSRKTS